MRNKIISVDFLKVERCMCLFDDGHITKVIALRMTTYKDGKTVYYPIEEGALFRSGKETPFGYATSEKYTEQDHMRLIFDTISRVEVNQIISTHRAKEFDFNSEFIEKAIRRFGIEITE